MGRKKRAPTHSLTHKMQFVPGTDGAWRHDLIDREYEELERAAAAEHEKECERAKKAGEDPPAPPAPSSAEHPYGRYQLGLTRYNLDDPELEKYLDREAEPEIWTIRRLSFDDRRICNHLVDTGQAALAQWHAFAAGVVGLEGPTDEAGKALADFISKLPRTGRTVKQTEKLKKKVADYAMGAVYEVGTAVVTGSSDMSVDEGKPSASSHTG